MNIDEYKVILASQSPRRKELLGKITGDFEVIVSQADETTKETSPEKIVMELSAIKAGAVVEVAKTKYPNNKLLIIGSDTVVSKDGDVMGKPKDASDAFDMIRSIAGDTHQVFTGVTLITIDGKKINTQSFYECTNVVVSPIDDCEIQRYIDTKDCMDKAGSYGIQGEFGVFVEKIDGDYNNVVGLPIARLYREIKKFPYKENYAIITE